MLHLSSEHFIHTCKIQIPLHYCDIWASIGPQVLRYLAKHYHACVCEGVLDKTIWISMFRVSSFMWTCFIQSTKKPNRRRVLSEGKLFSSDCISWDIGPSQPLDLSLNFGSSGVQAFRLEHNTISSCSPQPVLRLELHVSVLRFLACQMKFLWIHSLLKHMN